MLNNMHSHIIDPHIGIRMFHTVAIFFNQAKSTLYCCAKRLQFFVDNGIWSSWPVFTIAISKMCIRDKSTFRMRAWKNSLSIFLTDFFTVVSDAFSFIINTCFGKRIAKLTKRCSLRIESFWIDHLATDNNRNNIIAFVYTFVNLLRIITRIQDNIGYIKRKESLFEFI